MISANIKGKIKNLKTREIFSKIIDLLELPDIIILMGMRQTGKSSLLFLTIRYLLEKIPPKNLFYFSLEDSLVLDGFNRNQKELAKIIETGEVDDGFPCYIFIDEIQHLDDPTRFLKYYYDNYSHFKFIITGSSSFELRKKFKDSLAGRKKIIPIHPLSWREFLSFKNVAANPLKMISSEVESKKMTELWEEFIIFGGHPKIPQLMNSNSKIEELGDIFSSYLERDIRDIGNIENMSAYNNLVKMLAVQCGNLVSAKNISDNLGLNLITLRKYLFLLEKSFALSLLKPFFKNKIKEVTKMPKVYFEDIGIRNFAVSDFRALEQRPDLGALVENFVFNELQKRVGIGEEIFFWRSVATQVEVDFVLKKGSDLLPIEVKYQNYNEANISPGLKKFIIEHRPEKAIVVTKNFSVEIIFEKCKVSFVPVSVFSDFLFKYRGFRQDTADQKLSICNT